MPACCLRKGSWFENIFTEKRSSVQYFQSYLLVLEIMFSVYLKKEVILMTVRELYTGKLYIQVIFVPDAIVRMIKNSYTR